MASIIGAGPVGNYVAYLLAKQGEHVSVYEDHALAGKPVQCTGILTPYLSDVLKVEGWEDYLVNMIDSTRVFGPDGQSVTIRLKKNFIVDRALFDQHLARLAKDAGARYFYKHRFHGCIFKDDGVHFSFEHGRHGVDTHLIGADGPGSLVGKSAGIYGKRKLVIGVQARVAVHDIESSVVDFYLNKQEKGYIGWVVPEQEHIARVGVASYAHAHELFHDLMKTVGGGKILEWQSGAIPLYDPRLEMGVSKGGGHVFLVGDAATMVKATTYGGIVPGMKAAQGLAETLAYGGDAWDYDIAWRRKVGKELWLHLLIRKSMDRFSVVDYNRLLSYVNQKRILALIGKHDREYPSKLLLQMLVKEPRFLRFTF